MKAIAAILALCLIAQAAATSCAAAQYCMGCSATNTCDACFNWGSGKVGARSLLTNTCTAALTRTAADVKFYSGTHHNTLDWDWGAAACKKNDFVADRSGTTPFAASCTKTWPAGSTKIANCKYNSARKTSSSASVAYCLICDKNKGGNATNTSCGGTQIANCEYASGSNCHYCKSKFAVVDAGTSCVAFTTDKNCRKLATDSTCSDCWDAYYFNGATCKLFAKVLAAGFALAISAFLF